MLCQNCGKNIATTFIKKTINGETTQTHLCSECAEKQGYNSMFSNIGFDIGDFWGSLFAEPMKKGLTDVVRCEGCGHSFGEIAESGRAGCPSCYTTFYDRLLPSIQRIHGKTAHTGKFRRAPARVKKERELERLRSELAKHRGAAVREMCELRDQHSRTGKGGKGQ